MIFKFCYTNSKKFQFFKDGVKNTSFSLKNKVSKNEHDHATVSISFIIIIMRRETDIFKLDKGFKYVHMSIVALIFLIEILSLCSEKKRTKQTRLRSMCPNDNTIDRLISKI